MSILRSVAIALMLPASIADAQPTTYYGDGYSIVLPAEWIELPPEVLEAIRQQTTVKYLAGFAKGDRGGWAEYPYVLIQETPMPEGPVTKAEAVELVRMMAGMDLNEAVREWEAPVLDYVDLTVGETEVGLEWDRRRSWRRSWTG